MSLLVHVEQQDGALTANSQETLTIGRCIDASVSVGVVGQVSPQLLQSLAEHGVRNVYQIEHDVLSDFAPEAIGAAIEQLTDETGCNAVLGPGTETGNEIMAQVAARLDLPFAANCVAIQPGDSWNLTRLRWGGVLLEDAELEAPIKIATIAEHWIEANLADQPTVPELHTFVPSLDPCLSRTRVVERVTASDGISLATAKVVVSGGRGVGSAEGFAMLEELAGELGGAVGCSRVATNNGWRSHSDQVGQTGTRISPELYIACGISGATQHWAGCMGSKRILAINTDPEAPLVQRADYAVIGNLHEVLPAITAEVRRRKTGS